MLTEIGMRPQILVNLFGMKQNAGWTDRHDEANSRILQLVIQPKECHRCLMVRVKTLRCGIKTKLNNY
jgi:hypothetical protein